MTGYGLKTRLLAFSALLVLASCAAHDVDGNRAPLITPNKDTYTLGNSQPLSQQPWYQSFNDPNLDALIESGFASNLNIAQSVARYEQARALADQVGTAGLPTIDLSASGRKGWEDGNSQHSTREAGASLSWEIDLFDRLGSAARSGRLREEAAAADVGAVRLFLSADIADAYYGALARRKQIDLLRQQISADEELLKLNELRFQNGITTNVDVLQQQGQLADSKSLVPLAESQLRIFENRLDILTGNAPDGKDRTLNAQNLSLPTELPSTGIPSDLLLNRPDLRALRLDLIAADEDIGTAIADQLPRINLTGSLVYSAGAGVTGPIAEILGSVLQPLLDWGRREAEITRNKALYEEKLAGFTQAYIEAIEDVENALYQERQQRLYIAQLEERRRILQETSSQTQAQYTQGIADYLPVLNALKDLRQIERDLIAQQQTLIGYRIQLHRALGSALPAYDVTQHTLVKD